MVGRKLNEAEKEKLNVAAKDAVAQARKVASSTAGLEVAKRGLFIWAEGADSALYAAGVDVDSREETFAHTLLKQLHKEHDHEQFLQDYSNWKKSL